MAHKRRRAESGTATTRHQKTSLAPVDRSKPPEQYVYLAIYETYGAYEETEQIICEVYATALDANNRLRTYQGRKWDDPMSLWEQWDDGFDNHGCWHSIYDQVERCERYIVKRMLVHPRGTRPPPPPQHHEDIEIISGSNNKYTGIDELFSTAESSEWGILRSSTSNLESARHNESQHEDRRTAKPEEIRHETSPKDYYTTQSGSRELPCCRAIREGREYVEED